MDDIHASTAHASDGPHGASVRRRRTVSEFDGDDVSAEYSRSFNRVGSGPTENGHSPTAIEHSCCQRRDVRWYAGAVRLKYVKDVSRFRLADPEARLTAAWIAMCVRLCASLPCSQP
jgi:hypothetical protein